MSTTIPQRELRNESAAVLRRAEAGEEFVVTVDGRPVARLGPLPRQTWLPVSEVRALLGTPTDTSVLDDVAARVVDVLDDAPTDPFERAR